MYLRNGLTDRNEIWHDDAIWPSWPFRPLQYYFEILKNSRWRQPPFWEIEKIVRFKTESKNKAVSHLRNKK